MSSLSAPRRSSPSAFEEPLEPSATEWDEPASEAVFEMRAPWMPVRRRTGWHVVDWPVWFGAIVRELESLLDLPPAWDGRAALPVDRWVVFHAVELVSRFARVGSAQPNVVPTADGGVQLEWATERYEVEILISPERWDEVYLLDRETDEDEVGSVEELVDAIEPVLTGVT